MKMHMFNGLAILAAEALPHSLALPSTYLCLVGNGRMVVIVVIIGSFREKGIYLK